MCVTVAQHVDLCRFVYMEKQELLIDHRFYIHATMHTSTDLTTGTTTRLEPRLVKLLLLLAAHPGQLVTRDEIIREVWNNYGNADDGLNLAISFLRKVLDDASKNRIRTIPTKGYLLNATVTTGEATQQTVSPTEATNTPMTKNRKVSKRFITLSLIVLLIVCLLITGRTIFFPAQAPNPEPPGAVKDTTYQYQEMKELQQ